MKLSGNCGVVCVHPLAIEFSVPVSFHMINFIWLSSFLLSIASSGLVSVISDSSAILCNDIGNGTKLLLSSCCYGNNDLCILFIFRMSFSDHEVNRIG